MPTTIGTLRQEMDRLFDRVWEQEGRSMPMIGEWAPPLELSETKDGYLARVDIPGLDPKDVKITYRDDELTIRGEKRTESERKDATWHIREREYGSFTRVLRLPTAIDPERIKATFKNGVLTIDMAKSPAAKSAEIPVAVG